MTHPVLPDTYDFNEHYVPLYVKNQGTAPTCWLHSWSSRLEAYRRMFDNRVVTYDPYGISWGAYAPPPPAPYTGIKWVTPDGEMIILQTGRELTTVDDIKASLYRNGILELSVSSRTNVFANNWYRHAMPTLHLDPTDTHDLDHSIFAVGFTPDGMLIQNSWSLSWGYQGRAILGWDFVLSPKHCMLLLWEYPPNPLDGLVMPPIRQQPKPTPAPVPPAPLKPVKGKFMLIKLANDPAIWMVLGGARSHIPNMATLTAQGYTLHDVQTLPASNPLWKLPVVVAK